MPKPAINYKKYRASKAGKVPMRSLPAAVRMASQGEFIVDDNDIQTGQTYALATEYQRYAIGSTTSAMLYPSIKIWFWLHSLTKKMPIILAVYKIMATEPAVDITSEARLEELRSDGKLFYHHWHLVPAMADTSNIAQKPFMFEFKNVKLVEDEQLVVAFRTRAAVTDGWSWVVAKYSATEL